MLSTVRERVGVAEAALAVVLVAGVGLRLWLAHAWRPAFLGYPDSDGYIAAARLKSAGLLFWNPYRPAGYPLFLSWLHGVHQGLAFAIDVQHVMGLLVAVLLYSSVARFVRHRWVALLPAAVVVLSGSELYLEHSPLSEAPYTLLVALALWLAAYSYGHRGWREALLLFAAGLAIGASAPVRSVGVFVAPALIGWAAASRPGWRSRLCGGLVVLAGCLIALGGYLVYQHGTTGTWSLTRTTGETLYGRAAIFANCRDFTPPAGTRGLCPAAADRRLGATWFMFSGTSPATRTFGPAPDPRKGGAYTWPADGKMLSFAEAAILHQPWAYLSTTLQGLVKYVDPSLGTPGMLEWNHTTLIESLRGPPSGDITAEIAAYYPDHPTVEHEMGGLDAYARAAKVEGPVTAILLVLMLVGIVLAREGRRTGAGLFGWTTVLMLLSPVALLFYGARYATPAYGPLAAAAAFGLDAVLDRVPGAWTAFGAVTRHRRPDGFNRR